MIYEQQLNKILNPEGCGKRYAIEGCEEYFPRVGAICGDNRMHTEEDEPNLCPTHKAIQKAQIETLLICAKNEIEDFELLLNMLDVDEFNVIGEWINNKISQLQEVIKKLEEMK